MQVLSETSTRIEGVSRARREQRAGKATEQRGRKRGPRPGKAEQSPSRQSSPSCEVSNWKSTRIPDVFNPVFPPCPLTSAKVAAQFCTWRQPVSPGPACNGDAASLEGRRCAEGRQELLLRRMRSVPDSSAPSTLVSAEDIGDCHCGRHATVKTRPSRAAVEVVEEALPYSTIARSLSGACDPRSFSALRFPCARVDGFETHCSNRLGVPRCPFPQIPRCFASLPLTGLRWMPPTPCCCAP
jgi:hypothetical protein